MRSEDPYPTGCYLVGMSRLGVECSVIGNRLLGLRTRYQDRSSMMRLAAEEGLVSRDLSVASTQLRLLRRLTRTNGRPGAALPAARGAWRSVFTETLLGQARVNSQPHSQRMAKDDHMRRSNSLTSVSWLFSPHNGMSPTRESQGDEPTARPSMLYRSNSAALRLQWTMLHLDVLSCSEKIPARLSWVHLGVAGCLAGKRKMCRAEACLH